MPNQNTPQIYQIKVEGHLSPQWADWFGGLTVQLEENGCTSLTGSIVDQAALYGLLKKVRDLGMPLLSVMPIDQMPDELCDDINRREINESYCT